MQGTCLIKVRIKVLHLRERTGSQAHSCSGPPSAPSGAGAIDITADYLPHLKIVLYELDFKRAGEAYLPQLLHQPRCSWDACCLGSRKAALHTLHACLCR